ncbi:uncharacterized protein LOC131626428 [Vicia villosa]|uniref:uncharacterized protein LOC131626428 n=1 Tax=Vicia villosa TaxID=3911 RepID=UPI00273AB1B1|nr:uncharacterized protein LOC131626428 [Vicia villosa]
MFDPNINAALHAQNEILFQQMEYLLQSLSQFTPQANEFRDIGWFTPEDTMEYHIADHEYQQQAFQPYTQPSPQQQGYQSGPSELEETMNQFMQWSLSIQQNRETQDVQVTKFFTEQNVSQASTFQNPMTCVETCNATSIRSVKVIDEEVDDKEDVVEKDNIEHLNIKKNIEVEYELSMKLPYPRPPKKVEDIYIEEPKC